MGRKPDPAIRTRILDQAEHLIHLGGFHSTTMDEIAAACKMTKANLFHHYGSKEELGLAVLDAKMSDYRKRRVDPLCGKGDPIEAVRKMFRNAGLTFGANGCKAGCFVGNIALEMSDLNEQFRRRAGHFFEQWAQDMAHCLSKAKASGVFLETLDPKACAESIISLYEGAIMLARAQRDASVFNRVGKVAGSILQQHINNQGRTNKMGPKTPCGC